MADFDRADGLVEAVFALQTCIMEWRQIFRVGYQSLLYSFLNKYCDSEIKQIAGFVGGLMKDLEAVENAVSSPLSNGRNKQQAEDGQAYHVRAMQPSTA